MDSLRPKYCINKVTDFYESAKKRYGFFMRIQGVAKTFARRNAKTSKHRIPLTPLWYDHFKPNQQRFEVLYVGVTVSSLPSRFLGAMAVLIIRMIFTHQGQTTMKSASFPT